MNSKTVQQRTSHFQKLIHPNSLDMPSASCELDTHDKWRPSRGPCCGPSVDQVWTKCRHVCRPPQQIPSKFCLVCVWVYIMVYTWSTLVLYLCPPIGLHLACVSKIIKCAGNLKRMLCIQCINACTQSHHRTSPTHNMHLKCDFGKGKDDDGDDDEQGDGDDDGSDGQQLSRESNW